MDDAGSQRRDHAYLVLILLVGGAALSAGLYFLITQGLSSAAGVFDSVLGIAILLVGWLFLGPMLAPTYFGDLAPDAEPIERAYLKLPIISPVVERTSAAVQSVVNEPAAPSTPPKPAKAGAAAVAKPAPDIPRWADPMVAHFPKAPIPAESTAAGVPEYVETPPAAGGRAVVAPSDETVEELLHRSTPSQVRAVASAPPEMINELDQISAELRGPKRRNLPVSSGAGFEGHGRRVRGADGDVSFGGTAVQDDADFEPL